MQGPARIRFLCEDVDRHGNVRIYFRKPGVKIRLREAPYSEAFWARYHELLRLSAGGGLVQQKVASQQPIPGTYRWLCIEYFKSNPYRRLDPIGQRTRRGILESTCQEPIRPGSSDTFGDMPLNRITIKALRAVRDRKTPGAANNRVKAMRVMFKWAVDQEYMHANPARDLSKLSTGGPGFHSWTPEEVAQFEQRHPIGSRARLALGLMLWTGVRRSDVVLLGKQHIRENSWLVFRPVKTRKRGIQVDIPILPNLQRLLETSPTGDMTFLMTEQGRPFTANGFGNWFRERCVEAGVPGRAHGLRKAGAATAAANGATVNQLMAIFGWLTMSEAERYTRAAQRRKMAGDAMRLLVNESVPPQSDGGTKRQKK